MRFRRRCLDIGASGTAGIGVDRVALGGPGISVDRVALGGPGFYSAAAGVHNFSEAADGPDPGVPGHSDGPAMMSHAVGTRRTGASAGWDSMPKDAEVLAGKTELGDGDFEDEQPGTPGFRSIPTPSIGYMRPTAIPRSVDSAEQAWYAESTDAAVGPAVGQYSTVAYADDEPDGGRQHPPLLSPGPEDGQGNPAMRFIQYQARPSQLETTPDSPQPNGKRYSLI